MLFAKNVHWYSQGHFADDLSQRTQSWRPCPSTTTRTLFSRIRNYPVSISFPSLLAFTDSQAKVNQLWCVPQIADTAQSTLDARQLWTRNKLHGSWKWKITPLSVMKVPTLHIKKALFPFGGGFRFFKGYFTARSTHGVHFTSFSRYTPRGGELILCWRLNKTTEVWSQGIR